MFYTNTCSLSNLTRAADVLYILLRPHKVIDSTQAWFWSPEWQLAGREAFADLVAGRSAIYETSAYGSRVSKALPASSR
jgi:hypothetical protein